MKSRFANGWSRIKPIIMSNVYPFEVVVRVSQTHLQMGEHFKGDLSPLIWYE